MKDPRLLLYRFCYAAILLVFAYTFWVKVMDLDHFAMKLFKIPFLPIDWIPAVKYLVPASELAVMVLMWGDRTQALGAKAAFLLLSVFTAYLVFLHVVSPHTPCSCGGIFDQITFHQHLIVNGLLLLCAAGLIWLEPRRELTMT